MRRMHRKRRYHSRQPTCYTITSSYTGVRHPLPHSTQPIHLFLTASPKGMVADNPELLKSTHPKRVFSASAQLRATPKGVEASIDAQTDCIYLQISVTRHASSLPGQCLKHFCGSRRVGRWACADRPLKVQTSRNTKRGSNQLVAHPTPYSWNLDFKNQQTNTLFTC
jgi:hypothetical protein